ncbi:hypothetical protein D7Z54_31910 [Salibacterium salarium]|uniref:Uncharacterized protein n=1 Tax=Salibacterium salarium TaxID=284579 RepID=A0A428MT47_9BACI|nr:hypothetical protein [Salibacterium salarium]RSL29309.1 hypothetical protein D7Z54_31910 [Salibacterium salarium]
MSNEYISLISAGIGGMVALIVLAVNQLMQHKRWKENLQRKGEDKYLDQKIDTLHETNVELFKLANNALTLARIGDDKGTNYIADEYKILDEKIRSVIALLSPYLSKDKKEEIDILYDLLTEIRLRLNKEVCGEEKDIITHLYWLNESIWEFRDQLSIDMKTFYTDNRLNSNWSLKLFSISVLFNILFIIYILFM